MQERFQRILRDRYPVLLAVLTVLGLALRIWGAHFGLPHTYHFDELDYVPDAFRYISTMDFRPAGWANPTLFKYLLALEYGIIYLVGWILGKLGSVAELEPLFYSDPSAFYLLSRVSSALFGTATIPVAYAIGEKAYSKKVGLLAAAFLTTCFLHARDSHYAVSDIPMTFLFSLTILCCLLYWQHRQAKYFYLAAFCAGLAIATKYSAALLVVVLLFTFLLTHAKWVQGKGRWGGFKQVAWNHRGLIIGYGIMGFAFLMACPYALLDLAPFIQNLRNHYGMGKIGFAGYQIDSATGWVFYLKTLHWGLGTILFLLAVVAVFYALYQHQPADWIIVLPVLLLYVYMGKQLAFFARFIIPSLPLLMILAARLLWDVEEKVAVAIAKLPSGLFIAVATLLVIAQPTVYLIRHNVLLTRTDTRTIAKEWIESHIPAGAKFFVEWHTPPLATGSQPVPGSKRVYRVDSSYIIGLAEHPLEYYRQQGYEYLIASSFIYNIPRMDPREDESRRAFYTELDTEAKLVQVFKPYSDMDEPPFIFDQIYGPTTSLFQFERPGPTIKIYKIR